MNESRAQVFARLMSACEAGFDSPIHHRNWWRKHAAEIQALPPSMGDRVRHAWDQATAKEFSRAQPPAGPSK
jgi:hypothetical protein